MEPAAIEPVAEKKHSNTTIVYLTTKSKRGRELKRELQDLYKEKVRQQANIKIKGTGGCYLVVDEFPTFIQFKEVRLTFATQ